MVWGMNKVVPWGSYDFGHPQIQPVKMSSRGLIGADRDQFIKVASAEFIREVEKLARYANEPLIHMLALSATEAASANRNGDGFKEATCQRYHDTFVKHARFYRDHCFVAGTGVLMADRVRKPIEQVVVGDRVVTLAGDLPVTAVMRQDYAGAGCRIKLQGVPQPMIVTEGHPLWVLRRRQVHCRHNYSRLGCGRHTLACREWRDGLRDMQPAYVPAAEVLPDDYVLIPKPSHGASRVDSEFARLVGWVASEGHLGKKGSIKFTFAAANTADIASVTRCLHANGVHVSETPRDEYGTVQLSACSAALHARLSIYVQGILDQKRLTAAVLAWDAPSLLEMLAAYIEGDGHVGTKPAHRGQLRIRSSSRSMLGILSDVVRALGVPATVTYDRPAGQPIVSPTNGKTYYGRGSGVVAVAAHSSLRVAGGTRKAVDRGSRRQIAQPTIHGCFLTRVLSVDPVTINEPVFNLEVAGPHHYVANEVVVHNCNTDPRKSYGLVKLSWYNPRMRRVELIVGLNGDKEAAERNGGLVADKELEKLASGKDLGVSMATPVPYDVCFAAGTPVETLRGLCPVELVQAADTVKTHTGRWLPVTQTMRRAYSGTVVDVSVCGLLERITMTASHPVLAVRRETLFACHGSTAPGRRRRHTVRGGSDCITCRRPVPSSREWVDAQSLHVGDYVVYPVQTPGAYAPGISQAYMLGAYTGDGSRIQQGSGRNKKGPKRLQGVSLTLDNDWPEIINRVREHAAKIHGREQPTYPSGDGKDSVQVHVYSRDLADLCYDNVGAGCYEKYLSQEIFRLDTEHRLAFLAGLLDTDGSVDRGCRHGSGRISTINRRLADQVQKLFWGLGIPACVQSQVVEHGFLPGATTYTVSISAAGTAQLSGYSVKAAGITSPKKSHAQSFLLDGYMHMPITELHHRYDELDVFNFSVAEDETYVVGGFAVHNCSGCGNRARTRAEYCTGTHEGGLCKAGGLKNNIGAMVELDDGSAHHLHADNPIVRWKDISHVWRPADKTGYATGLLKAASQKVVSGAEWAEMLNVRFKTASLLDAPSSTALANGFKIACRLADLEADMAGGGFPPSGLKSACDVSARGEEDPPPSDFQEKMGGWLRAFADQQVCMPLMPFIVAMTGVSLSKAASIASTVHEFLPGIYSDLVHREDFHQKLAENPYTPSRLATPAMQMWALRHSRQWGTKTASVRERACVAALRGFQSTCSFKAASVVESTAPKQMAEQYALYKLAYLTALPHDVSEDPLTLSLCIVQNAVR